MGRRRRLVQAVGVTSWLRCGDVNVVADAPAERPT